MRLVGIDAHLLQLIKSTLNELIPVDLITQVIENPTGIAKVRVLFQVSSRSL